MPKEYRTIQEVAGPLMLVRGVENVHYDELGEIELASGETRRCKVLEINGTDGTKQEVRRNYTILGVPDDVFQREGISSCDDLVKKLGAGEDYENKNNALNRYAAYHILNGRYKVDNLKKFDVDKTV